VTAECARQRKRSAPCPLPFLRDAARAMKMTLAKSKGRTDSRRHFSSVLVDASKRATAGAMHYPVGFTDEDIKKPIIGVASNWSNITSSHGSNMTR